MPTSGRSPEILIDTSVAVALVLEDHEHHAATLEAVGSRRAGLAGHAAFETFSVLTRLPSPARRPPQVVARLLSENFPESRFLSPERAAELPAFFARARIAGGAVYDGLVGAVAVEHGLSLVTRDQRALSTYHALGVDIELVAG